MAFSLPSSSSLLKLPTKYRRDYEVRNPECFKNVLVEKYCCSEILASILVFENLLFVAQVHFIC